MTFNFSQPLDIGDRKIEVIGLESCLHMGQVRTGLRASGQYNLLLHLNVMLVIYLCAFIIYKIPIRTTIGAVQWNNTQDKKDFSNANRWRAMDAGTGNGK